MEGDRMPIHAAAGAKVILAHSRPDLAEQLLQRELRKFTAKTITVPEAFIKRLAEFKKKGYSEDLGEINIDVHAVGAPSSTTAASPLRPWSLPHQRGA